MQEDMKPKSASYSINITLKKRQVKRNIYYKDTKKTFFKTQ